MYVSFRFFSHRCWRPAMFSNVLLRFLQAEMFGDAEDEVGEEQLPMEEEEVVSDEDIDGEDGGRTYK